MLDRIKEMEKKIGFFFLSQAVKKKRPKDKKCSSEAKYETITVGSSRLLHSTFICGNFSKQYCGI